MSQIKTLQNIYQTEGLKFILDLFNDYVIISEKICGTRFSFKKLEDSTFEFYKKDGKITQIDRLLNSTFDGPINYILSLSGEQKSAILPLYTYGLRIIEKEPIFVTYDNKPLNSLILTDVKNPSDKIIDDVNVLNKIAKNLAVENPPIIFSGKLDDAQKQNISNYLKLSEQDILIKFGDNSFTRYIISVLNPLLNTTAAKTSIDLPIDSVIFKFIDLDKRTSILAKLVDPSVAQIAAEYNEKKEIKDLYGIILGDIVEFILQKNLDLYKLKRIVEEERYLELVYFIFNDYIFRSKNKYSGMDSISIPSVAKKFNVNSNLIFSDKTKELITEEINKDILKIFISAFSKTKYKTSDTVSQSLIDNIKKVKEKIDLRISKKEINESSETLTFEEFMQQNKF